MPDSGIPGNSDQLSCLSGGTDVIVTAGTAETSHMFEEEVKERLWHDLCSNNVLPQPLKKRGRSWHPG